MTRFQTPILLAVGLTTLLTACQVSPARLAPATPTLASAAKSTPAKSLAPLRYKQQSISVSNVDRSAAFYTRHFGYTISERQTFPDLELIVLQRADHRLQLMSGGKVEALDWRHSMGFFARDFDTLAKELPLLRPPFQVTPGGPRILFAKDPDGYPVEVIEDLPAAK